MYEEKSYFSTQINRLIFKYEFIYLICNLPYIKVQLITHANYLSKMTDS